MRTGNGRRCAAVVVLYHPGAEVIENIRSWAGQVETVYAVDNTELPGPGTGDQTAGTGDRGLGTGKILATIGNVMYLPQGENRGIARALNIGAGRAFNAGYDWLLTMDQDSRAAGDLVARLLECGATVDEPVGIVSPFHRTKAVRRGPSAALCSEVLTPMTSGCLLNLAAWQTVGQFRDDFFIDFVDDEYCLRLRREGYRVLRANRAILEHQVGDIRRFGPLIATNHSPLRRYYKTRNRFVVNREYRRDVPLHCFIDRIRMVKEIGSIILFEEEKWAKLRMMWRGWRDYRRGIMGKYESKP